MRTQITLFAEAQEFREEEINGDEELSEEMGSDLSLKEAEISHRPENGEHE